VAHGLLIGRLEIVDVQHLAGPGRLAKASLQGLFLGHRHVLALASANRLRFELLDPAAVVGHMRYGAQRNPHRRRNCRLRYSALTKQHHLDPVFPECRSPRGRLRVPVQRVDENSFPRKIGADAWFTFRNAERFEVQEQSFRLPNDEVLTLLIIPDEGWADQPVRGGVAAMDVDVLQIPVPKERLLAVPKEERALFFMLGYDKPSSWRWSRLPADSHKPPDGNDPETNEANSLNKIGGSADDPGDDQ
jgi:hypothetical protein